MRCECSITSDCSEARPHDPNHNRHRCPNRAFTDVDSNARADCSAHNRAYRPTRSAADPHADICTARADRELRPLIPDRVHPSVPARSELPTDPVKRFRVLPPDPHRFDGDHDGIGCES